MSDLISIVVPVYNAEKTLERCIRSLQGQTYERIEIILVNDGSRDDSLTICRAFAEKDSRIRVIDKPNGGVSSARNAGMDIAGGKFIMFCDSDDWVDPQWCKTMIAHQQLQDLTICDIARDDISEASEKQEADLLVETVERKDFLHYPMLMCSPVNKIYLREVIEKNGLRFPEKLSLGEDFSFVLSYLCKIKGKVHFIKQKLYYYDVSAAESLSKKAPTLEQCDCFYWLITSAMEEIEANDEESIRIRDSLVMGHFERFLIFTSQRKDISLMEKMSIAGKTGRMESFAVSSRHGLEWLNPICLWLYRRKHVRLVMLYLILSQLKNRR